MEKSCVTTSVSKMSSLHVESSTRVRFTHQLDEKLKDQKLIGRVVLTSNPYYFYIQSDDQDVESLDAQLQIELNSSDAEVSLAMPSPRLGRLFIFLTSDFVVVILRLLNCVLLLIILR
jgi:hypothetical protein